MLAIIHKQQNAPTMVARRRQQLIQAVPPGPPLPRPHWRLQPAPVPLLPATGSLLPLGARPLPPSPQRPSGAKHAQHSVIKQRDAQRCQRHRRRGAASAAERTSNRRKQLQGSCGRTGSSKGGNGEEGARKLRGQQEGEGGGLERGRCPYKEPASHGERWGGDDRAGGVMG